MATELKHFVTDDKILPQETLTLFVNLIKISTVKFYDCLKHFWGQMLFPDFMLCVLQLKVLHLIYRLVKKKIFFTSIKILL